MKYFSFIPNLLTLFNLLSGCLAVIYAVNNNIKLTVLFVLLGILFDFFDGFVARILNVQSELGKQLDSLADMVTSGVVPGIVMVQMLLIASQNKTLSTIQYLQDFPWIAVFGFAITLASCYRLANFNIDENQKESFVGLPTPANTLFILSLPLMNVCTEYSYVSYVVDNLYALILVTVVSCYLLNAKIELFALKFKNFGFAENKIKYFFLGACLLLIGMLKLAAIPAIILLYVLLSVMTKKKSV